MENNDSIWVKVLAEAIPQIVWTAKPDGRIDYLNRRWFDFTGQRCGDALGWGWFSALHPEDVDAAREGYRHAMSTGQPWEHEFRIRCKDGAYRWHLGRGSVARNPETAGIAQWFGTCTDIHEQKMARESGAFLLEVGEVLSSSLEHDATLANVVRLLVPRLADWCLMDLKEEHGGIRRIGLFHGDPSLREPARELEAMELSRGVGAGDVFRVLETGEPLVLSTVNPEALNDPQISARKRELLRELGTRSAAILPLAVRGRVLGALTLVFGHSGRIYEETTLALAREVVARVSVAVDNANLYRSAKEAIRAREEFCAIASHELSSPLTSLMFQLRLTARALSAPGVFRDGSLGERALAGLSVSENQARRLSGLVRELFDLARIQSGGFALERKTVELSGLVEKSVRFLQAEAQARGVAVNLFLEPGVVGSWDPSRLEQVVVNLVSNAIKYGAGRPVEVRLKRHPDRSHALLEVEDRGIGIPRESQARIFQCYEQAGSEARASSGLGLGLYIVRKIVAAHGGSIRVSSEPGRGSVFTVGLPLFAERVANEAHVG